MPEDMRIHLLNLINWERGKHGLPPLQLDEGLAHAAKAHSEHDIDQPGLAHAPEHLRPNVLENVASYEWRGPHSQPFEPWQIAEKIVQLWMDSPSHRAAMLDPHITHVGADIAHRHLENNKRKIHATARFR
ncbi:MAG: CAP domain-containing protein [Candidatus Diapherotrites archaeon]|nr:CAP domain-containing protein [Candidatus Diapherotrites archaeon]